MSFVRLGHHKRFHNLSITSPAPLLTELSHRPSSLSWWTHDLKIYYISEFTMYKRNPTWCDTILIVSVKI